MRKYTLNFLLWSLAIVCLGSMLLLAACSEDDARTGIEWKKLGLDGKIVNQLKLFNQTLYVATTSGLYKREINRNANFLLIGFENKNVQAIQVLNAGELLASLVDKSGVEQPGLYRTTNDGQTWSKVDSDFGGVSKEPIFDITFHPENKNTLFGAGYSVVARSTDGGVHWEPLYGNWGGFASGVSVVTLNPKDLSEIWAGGQGAIENGFLLRSRNTTQWDTWNDLVDNPTVVKEIAFTDANKDHVLVGFEGALLRTTNSGQSWETLIDSEVHKFFFGVRSRPGNPARIYAAGWIKTSAPQPLVLHVSDDGGASWHEHTHSSESFGGVWDLEIKSEAKQDRLFVGLNQGGVYEIVVPAN